MTMLTHGPFRRARPTSSSRGGARARGAAAPLATIKRYCIGAVTILAAGIALVAIMALKIAIYLPHFLHH